MVVLRAKTEAMEPTEDARERHIAAAASKSVVAVARSGWVFVQKRRKLRTGKERKPSTSHARIRRH